MKIINFIILSVFGAILFYSSFLLPSRCDLHAPFNEEMNYNTHINAANYYIEHAYHDNHTPNMVTVTLADYRGYDTLGETTVICTAGLICFLVLRKKANSHD
jgi:multicomponent Na+:H+ antiporter subunit B